MEIQQVIIEIKERTGLSDSKIAQLVGISQPSLSRLRTGRHKYTSFETGSKIVELWKSLKK